jgi:acyl-CoA thioester hydrolase
MRVRCPVYFDELDPNGHLHNTRFAVHVERATTALFAAAGFDTATVDPRPADLRYVVRQFAIEFHAPFRGTGELLVDLRVQSFGRTSLVWAFDCYPAAPSTPCASGTRTIVKVDELGSPLSWSDQFRTVLSSPEFHAAEIALAGR